MKKILMVLMLVVLLGQFPMEAWENGTPEQQLDFMKRVASQFCMETECKKAKVIAVTNGKEVFIFAECLDKLVEL
jgi:hypothetical protein